jgi:hypothetical protein
MSAKTDEWNNAVKNSDPNDPTVQPKFLQENLEPSLEEFKKGFTTEKAQLWAEAHTSSFRNHMSVKTSADMATMAGEAAKVNFRQTVNSLSNTVRNDPTSIDFTLQTYESTVNSMVDSLPNLKGTMAGKVKTELMQHGYEEIIKSAALGHIEKTGEIPEWVNDPKYSKYINGAELKQFEQAAKNYNRLNSAESRSVRVQRDYEAKSDFNRRVNELEAESIPKNPGDQPTLPDNAWDRLRDLAKHPGAALEPGRLKSTIQQFETLTNRLNKAEPLGPVSHATTVDIMKRMRSDGPDRLKNDNAIFEAFNDGKLSKADFNFLRKEWSDMKTPTGDALNRERGEFMKRFESYIDPDAALGVKSPSGQARMYMFEMAARRQEEQARRDGKDPHVVYDPESPYFFGRPANVAKYRRTLQDKMNDMRGVAPEPPTAPEPPGLPSEQLRTQGLQLLNDQLKANSAPALPTVRNKAEFDALPPGARYLGDDGRPYRKPDKVQR